LDSLPEIHEIPRHPILKELIFRVLGSQAGIVRVLYFDKPPDCSWSLPWHRDQTIAVKDNKKPTSHFQKPTTKAGIPHVEAPVSLLTRMLTLRLHLDAMTSENGPLSVIPGSHDVDQGGTASAVELHASKGDVLCMRPLLSHSSRASAQGTGLHRRIIHLELAPTDVLPDGYEWQWYYRVG
jgi:ectoine hydroxylase-related dioxygenase (phytanoyl-CoA dioxygenase family)